MAKEIEIPEGYEARIEGNKVIFEQKDSEDEKIRKSIIHLLQVGGYMSQADKTKAFAWLEKQKEQNLSYIEDIDYEENFDLAKNAIGMVCHGACYINNRTRNEIFDWLENVPKTIKQLTTKINELERQKEQKPAEWSEEDEYVINKVLNWAEIVNPTSTIFEKLPKEQFIERLKSLRPQPHWKPSEEQMKALDSAINYLTKHTCTPGNPLLISLYHDLQKLL